MWLISLLIIDILLFFIFCYNIKIDNKANKKKEQRYFVI